MADWTPQSRAEEILFKTINGEPYDGLPQSRIEELLLELKEVIEQGGGGGGGTYTTTVLFTNGASGDTTFQLSSAYTNFDAIAIYYSHFDGQDQYEDVRIYPTTFLNSVSSTDEVLGFTNDVWYYYFSVYSTTEFRYVKSNAGYITDIIGIKYGSNSGGGGTDNYNSLKNLPQINGTTLKGNKTASDLGLPSVAANPTGEAVGELTSIDINGSKYSIPESSEYEETTLWTGSGNMLSSFTATIANPYTDYDALRFEYESGNSAHNYLTHYERLISKDTLATPEWFSLSDFYLANGAGVNSAGKFTDTTHLSVQLHVVSWFTSCTLTKIVGIKYGNGVSGGGDDELTTAQMTNLIALLD